MTWQRFPGTPDWPKVPLSWYAATTFLWRKAKGATAVEYGLLVALIAAVIVTIVATLGTQINAAFNSIVQAL